MNRKYLSGAEKRKLAADKKSKENELMEKVPKIDDLFSVGESTSTSRSNVTESVNENINDEIHSPAIHEENVIDSMEIDNETIEVSSGTTEFSNDAALWDISKNITSQQDYWISKGTIR